MLKALEMQLYSYLAKRLSPKAKKPEPVFLDPKKPEEKFWKPEPDPSPTFSGPTHYFHGLCKQGDQTLRLKNKQF